MPIRNPFARRPGAAGPNNDENARPEQDQQPGFERVDTVGSKASSALSIRSNKSHDTGEYKMSGVYLDFASYGQAAAAPRLACRPWLPLFSACFFQIVTRPIG